MSWLAEQITLLRDFLRSDFRRFLIGCALGIAGAVILGVIAGFLWPQLIEQVLTAFLSMVSEAGVMDSEGDLSLFPLLLNNWTAMLTSLLYGFVPFACLSAVALLSNGLLLGLMAAWYAASGMSLLLFAAGLIPHGIFEVPALVLSAACGLYLCRNMSRIIVNSPRRVPQVELLSDLLRVLVLLVAPLTVAAALMECYVTPLIMALFM